MLSVEALGYAGYAFGDKVKSVFFPTAIAGGIA
jgi:hypothetical protein